MVNATYFTYDGVCSAKYGLQIADFDSEAKGENEAFSPSLTLLKVPSLIRFYHGGVEFDSAPTCEFTVVSQEIIPAELRSSILSWLIGRKKFLPLQFHQDDLEGFTYYCVFTSATTIFINGHCHGFRFTASFDSQFARGTPTSVTTNGGTIQIDNKSDITDGYTYPVVEFTGDVNIINTTDDASRAFTFSGLEASEQVTVNNETKIITSTVDEPRLDKFTTKNWLRLRPGINVLTVTGTNVTITCPYYAMIGY